MKTFFNVLYRRILYKIPLKLLLVILALCAIFIASFSNAGLVKTSYQTYVGSQNDKSYVNNSCDMICINPNGATCQDIYIAFNLNHTQYAWSIRGGGNIGNTYGFCSSEHTVYFSSFDGCTFTIDCYNFTEYTSLQCQTQYSLIPVSSVDQNYCTSNNLCPAQYTESQCKSVYGLIDESECTGGSGSGLSFSELYINNILHVGAPTILMNIPEEINREYAYTQGGNIMNIDVFGYNVDYEKMQGVIDTQSYIPTEEDFNNIVAILGPYSKIIIFFVFLFIVWAWIKKPFKSKKL